MYRSLYPARTPMREVAPVVGSFAVNNTSAVSLASRKGLGWTVVRTSAGLFTVTFTDKYFDLIAFTASIQRASADDQYLQMGTLVNTATPVIQIRMIDASAGTVVDMAANANNRINFTAWFRNVSAGQPTTGV